MKISNEKVKQLLGTGFKLILDRFFTAPSNEQMFATVNRFIKHRHLLTQLKKALDSDTVTKEKLKSVIDKEFNVVKPYNYTPESKDCDNAAFEVLYWLGGKGYPAGVGIIEGHALTVFINDLEERVFLDQYTGRVYDAKDQRLKVTVMG
jgi:hypothetical protein